MRTFGAIAINILTVVIMSLNSIPEQLSCCLDFFANFWQVGKLKWSAVFFDEIVHINFIEQQSVIS
jgi:hypothetical protein